VEGLLELLAQKFELVGFQAGDGCRRGEERRGVGLVVVVNAALGERSRQLPWAS